MAERIREGSPVHAGGLSGAAGGLLITALHQNVANRPFVLLTPGERSASERRHELHTLYDLPAHQIPTWELTGDESDPAHRPFSSSSRLDALRKLHASGSNNDIWVCSLLSLMQGVPEPEALNQYQSSLEIGQKASRKKWIDRLATFGYERVDRVLVPGQFAVRGGILDLFPEGREYPLRLEFFDQQIESIRTFDPGQQSSINTLNAVEVLLLDRSKIEQYNSFQSGSLLLDLFDVDPLFIWMNPEELHRRADRIKRRHGQDAHERFVEVTMHPVSSSRVGVSSLPPDESKEKSVTFRTGHLAPLGEEQEEIVNRLTSVTDELNTVYLVCQTEGERKRLKDVVGEHLDDPDTNLQFLMGYLTGGFVLPELNIGILGRDHLRDQKLETGKQVSHEQGAGTRPVDDFLELDVGDYVVHVDHGIARFGGLATSEKDGERHDVMKLYFRDSVELEVPETEFHRVQKYLGSGSGNPTLSKLTGTRWEKKKKRVGEAVRELGKEMIEVQAMREKGIGHACRPDTDWQAEFEAAFPHNETEDQERVNRKIKKSMESPQPMDMLLTGDVGFGKTELAMRAAFKMVMDGKQVALLAPTTVLTRQHLMTFRERMGTYPINIESLSRFRTTGEQNRIIREMKEGQTDIVIGTHRLLSDDVEFDDLGLVIIDEEQRFGVEDKEHLKRLRTTVDVLTMTATPIPRSLHMALLGIRDIATLRTPPGGRREIQTNVINYDEESLRNALVRELDRDGQVYYLHNRVKTIEKARQRVEEMVPEASVAIGHGQMNEKKLQNVMMKFYEGDIDILVCTTIIESGVDHKNVNTMVVEDADHFGLADLHQLRGRIGRHHRQAYVYFVKPTDRSLTPEAQNRLEAIQEYSELGSGFRVALRDLEIRGAGRLLGREQSGHINTVGYDLYCKLLKRELKRLKGEEVPEEVNPSIQLPVILRVPESYSRSEKDRIRLYQRFGSCESLEEVENLLTELRDLYGSELPDAIKNLAAYSKLRVRASQVGASSIKAGDRLIIVRSSEPGGLDTLEQNFPDLVERTDTDRYYLFLDASEMAGPKLLDTLLEMFQTVDKPDNLAQKEAGSTSRATIEK